MTEKLGIVVGVVSFVGFSVFCTWHHAMSPGMHLPDSASPPSASLNSPFSSAVLPASPTVTNSPLTSLPSPETVIPVPVPPTPPSEPQKGKETSQQSLPHTLRGKVVEFYADSDILTPKGRGALNTILPVLRHHPATRVEIAGHTDNLGTEDYNLALSQRRAETVKQYFLSQGVAEDHLLTQGYGSSLPIADNATAEGRQRNRRTEVIVRPFSMGS